MNNITILILATFLCMSDFTSAHAEESGKNSVSNPAKDEDCSANSPDIVIVSPKEPVVFGILRKSKYAEISHGNPAVFELNNGEILVCFNKPAFVKTPYSMVRMSPFTLALIYADKNITIVRNLWQKNDEGILQTIETKFVNIAWCQRICFIKSQNARQHSLRSVNTPAC